MWWALSLLCSQDSAAFLWQVFAATTVKMFPHISHNADALSTCNPKRNSYNKPAIKTVIIPSTGIEKDDNSWSCFTWIYTTLCRTVTLLVKFTVYFVTSTQPSESQIKNSIIPISSQFPHTFPLTHYDAVLLSRKTKKTQLHWICVLLISKDLTPWQNRTANGALCHIAHILYQTFSTLKISHSFMVCT